MVKSGRSQRNAQRNAARPPADGSRPAPPAQAGLWLYGRHAVLAAVANPRRRIHRLLALPDTAPLLAEAVAQAVAQAPHAPSRPAVETADRRSIAARLPADAVHQGFAAQVAPLPLPDLAVCELATPALPVAAQAGTATASGAPQRTIVVVLDQVTDPRNLGAVLRSADAFAAAAVIVQSRHAPSESGALAKAASGALERVPLLREVNLVRVLRSLQHGGYAVVGLAADAELSLQQAQLDTQVALVLGAEGTGLRRLVRESCDVLARVPIGGAAESLNVAATAAIALYECRRSETPG